MAPIELTLPNVMFISSEALSVQKPPAGSDLTWYYRQGCGVGVGVGVGVARSRGKWAGVGVGVGVGNIATTPTPEH